MIEAGHEVIRACEGCVLANGRPPGRQEDAVLVIEAPMLVHPGGGLIFWRLFVEGESTVQVHVGQDQPLIGSPQVHEGVDLLEGRQPTDAVRQGRDTRRESVNVSDKITGSGDYIFEQQAAIY